MLCVLEVKVVFRVTGLVVLVVFDLVLVVVHLGDLLGAGRVLGVLILANADKPT